MHGEPVGFYPYNIVSDINCFFAIVGVIGLIFKIKKLYIGLLFSGIIGLGQSLLYLVYSWFSFLFLSDPRANPFFLTVVFIYPLFFYGGLLLGYKSLNENSNRASGAE